MEIRPHPERRQLWNLAQRVELVAQELRWMGMENGVSADCECPQPLVEVSCGCHMARFQVRDARLQDRLPLMLTAYGLRLRESSINDAGVATYWVD